jgi:hypothetical protein
VFARTYPASNISRSVFEHARLEDFQDTISDIAVLRIDLGPA